MNVNEPSGSVIELRPMGMYDTGLQVLKPDVDSAVSSMIATGCTVIIYEKKTLMSLYKNVSRRNERECKATGRDEVYRLWTHCTEKGDTPNTGRWMVRVRQEGELVNPFFGTAQDNDSSYGRWLPLVEQIIKGEEVTVDSAYEVTRVGQSFRIACDRHGYLREGHMLQRRKVGKKFVIGLKKPLERPEKPAEAGVQARADGKKEGRGVKAVEGKKKR